MPSPYAVSLRGESGVVEATGELDFTDPDNQPAGTGVPFKPAAGDDVVVLEDSDGNPLISGGDDTDGVVLKSSNGDNQVIVSNGGIEMVGTVILPSVLNGGVLPSSDPHADGQLWSDSGVLTVSAG